MNDIVPAVWERDHTLVVTSLVRTRDIRNRFGRRLDTVSGMLGVIRELTAKLESRQGYVPPF
jgi:hypothetical protein